MLGSEKFSEKIVDLCPLGMHQIAWLPGASPLDPNGSPMYPGHI